MKRIVLLLVVTLFSALSFAQLSIGLQGTGSISDAHIRTASDLSYKKQMRAMPGGGVVLQYAVSKKFAVRTGVNYIKNGVNLTTSLTGPTMNVKLENNLHYVQVPLNLLFTLPLSRIQLYAGGGGYVNYGVSGKVKSTVSYTTPDGHESVTVDNVDAFKKEEDGGAGFRKTDFGVGALAGVRFSKVFVQAGYQLSLSNLPTGNDNGQYKNRSLQLTIGYFLR